MKIKQITADLFETYVKDLPVATSGIATIEDTFFRTYICIKYPAIGERIEITYLPWDGVYFIEKFIDGDYYSGQNPVFESKVLRKENSNEAEVTVQKILTDIGYTKSEEQSVENVQEQIAEEKNEEVLENIEEDSKDDILSEEEETEEKEVYGKGGKTPDIKVGDTVRVKDRKDPLYDYEGRVHDISGVRDFARATIILNRYPDDKKPKDSIFNIGDAEPIRLKHLVKVDDQMAGGGKTKEEWFQEAINAKAPFNLGGWHKNQSAEKRRELSLESRDQRTSLHDQYLSASRALQALANVTQDANTKILANQDAEYFRNKALKEKDKMAGGGNTGSIKGSQGDRHKYYVKAFTTDKNFKDKKAAFVDFKPVYWDAAKELQDKLMDTNKYHAVTIYAVKDNRNVSDAFNLDKS